MGFDVSQLTLKRLEWPAVLARLAGFTRTPQARDRLLEEAREEAPGASLFESSLAGMRERLAETSEARLILSSGTPPPLAGVSDPGPALRRAGKGGALEARELLELASTLAALRSVHRFLGLRQETAPLLADKADTIDSQPELERDIQAALEPGGEVRDGASPALAEARRESRRLAGEIQARLGRYLRDPDILARLSDAFYTVRNDRFVLPVKAEARSSVRGIVHDASRSGTTLFIEPEALVEANNAHKQAEIEIDRETRRVLRELSARAAGAAPDIESGCRTLEIIDLAFARAQLADETDATEPQVGAEGIVRLPQLRHPALPADRSVPNDMRLGEALGGNRREGPGFSVLVLSGPNAGGKTVAMKSVALAVLFARAGLHVLAAPGARVDVFDAVHADIGDEQDIGENLSTFSAHLSNLARIVDAATDRSLVVLDEIGVGTDPGEGAALAQAVLEALADAGARVVTTTHYNLLKEMAEVDPRFANASVEFDAETLAPTYRLRMGLPGASSATAVAARMGLRADVLERANSLLEREDRRLDRLLSELAASRATLEREQREAAHLRAETEAQRAEYRSRLERLQERRDTLYRAMREDLDAAFREAHDKVAGVVRELQRGGTSRDAARAREDLLELQANAAAAAEEAGIPPDAGEAGDEEAHDPVDWRFARAGDPVHIRGGGSGVLETLPDRKGRVTVRVGSARIQLPAERVAAAEPGEAHARTAVSIQVPAPTDGGDDVGGPERCDLRGQRVDEALDDLTAALDRAMSAGRGRLTIVHGLGTGALRSAVRRYLADSPYVARFASASPGEGGDGVTIAELPD